MANDGARTYPRYWPDADGWSEWVRPVVDNYRIACCDCGLVHNMEFRTADDGLPEFRVSRNNRSTGQLRRHAGITVKTS